jgi:hypothetical protein
MNQSIHCPKCGNEFNVEHALTVDIEKKLQHQFQEKLSNSLGEIDEEKNRLKAERDRFEEAKKKENEIFKEKLNQEKQKLMDELNKQIRDQMQADFEQKMNFLQNQNQEQEAKLKAAQDKELQFLRLQQELKTKEAEMEINLQKQLMQERNNLSEQIRQQEAAKLAMKEEEFTMRLKEMEKQLEDQVTLANEMKRKADQGSMQLQGEVQELALEDLLRNTFIYDQVSEVGKGVRGADCMLTVRNQLLQECGNIIFESKRTENFGADWIEKLKNDMRSQKAELAVIVTKAMPKDMDHFGEKNGVYICSFREVVSLTQLLRMALIKVSEAKRNQENKGDKMVALYNYLTGQEFVGNWSAIRDGFRNLRNLLQKEREDFERNWKKKEKQLDLIIQNSLYISGSIEGISGMENINMQLSEDAHEQLPEDQDGTQ